MAKTPVKASVTVKETVPIAPKEDATPVSEGFAKARSAINGALSIDALDLIEEQIKKSVKLTEVEKPELFTLLLLKKKELNGNK